MAKSTTRKPARRRAKPPHNAAKPTNFRSVGELARAIGAEPRGARLRGQAVIMSQTERLCRLILENALDGKVPDLKFLIQTMAKYPQIAGSAKQRWVLLLAGADADL